MDATLMQNSEVWTRDCERGCVHESCREEGL